MASHLKTTSQQIQLQQLQQSGSVQTSLPQQILLRPTQGSGQAQFQGINDFMAFLYDSETIYMIAKNYCHVCSYHN